MFRCVLFRSRGDASAGTGYDEHSGNDVHESDAQEEKTSVTTEEEDRGRIADSGESKSGSDGTKSYDRERSASLSAKMQYGQWNVSH